MLESNKEEKRFEVRGWSDYAELLGGNRHLIGRTRKADVWLPGKGNSNSHGARPVHLIITMIKWIQTSRLSIKNFLSIGR